MSRQKYYINKDRRIRREYKRLIKEGKMQITEAKYYLAEREGLSFRQIRRIVENNK